MFHQFSNDYSEIGHEKILSAILKYSEEQNKGYGCDKHTLNAKKKIREVFKLSPETDIYFLPGGTATNMIVISYFLKTYEAVLTVDTGHINVHETGAVEGSGHKVYTVINSNGKIKPSDIEKTFNLHSGMHMVKIKMVYITNSTEIGSIYTTKELLDIRKTCDKYGLLLFIDGARLGSALTSKENDVDVGLLGKIADIFYIGGTKNGLLYGEAVIIKDKSLSKDFLYHIKNKGGLMAKGFILGIQFEELFNDNLYFELAKKTNEMAEYIQKELIKLNVKFEGESCTNQIFIRVNEEKAKLLNENFGADIWDNSEEEKVVRICTSFSTKKEHCDQIINFIRNMK